MHRFLRSACAAVAIGALAGLSVPAGAQNSPVTITIDTTQNRHIINPNIYGVAFGTPAQLADLNAPLTRWGGNNTSRYNWKLNADNRGSDWYFESIAYSNATPGGDPDAFISNAQSAAAQAMMTMPMVGWVAKLGANRGKLASFSIAKYGAQTGNDWQWYADAGNGVSQATGKYITGNDPNDANVPADSLFQQSW